MEPKSLLAKLSVVQTPTVEHCEPPRNGRDYYYALIQCQHPLCAVGWGCVTPAGQVSGSPGVLRQSQADRQESAGTVHL